MRIRKLITAGIVILGIGSGITAALFFMKIGILWELELFEVPLILFMSFFLVASFVYEDSIRELIQHLEIQRFGAFIALVIGVFSLTMKILQYFF